MRARPAACTAATPVTGSLTDAWPVTMKTTVCGSTIGTRFASAFVAMVMTAVSMVLVAPVASASSTTSHRPDNRSDRYLLALGDSISFGFQGPKVTDPPNPAMFDTGHADVLA